MSTTGTPLSDERVIWPDASAECAGARAEDGFVRDCMDTLVPLIDRAARTCESLRETCAIAAPADKSLRSALGEVSALLDRADALTPNPWRGNEEDIAADSSVRGDAVRDLVYEAIASMRQDVESRSQSERDRIDRLTAELGDRVAALGERVEVLASGSGSSLSAGVGARTEHPASELVVDRAAIDMMIEEAVGAIVSRTMTVWERETVQLMELFRARVDRAISSVESAASERSRQLDELCGRVDRIFAQAGGDPVSLTGVVGELVESMKPWRGLLVEGKCGPDLAPLVHSIVERVRADIGGDVVGRLDELDAALSRVAARAAAGRGVDETASPYELACSSVHSDMTVPDPTCEQPAPRVKALRANSSRTALASKRAGTDGAKSPALGKSSQTASVGRKRGKPAVGTRSTGAAKPPKRRAA